MPTTPDLATTVAAVLMFNGRPIGTTSIANNPLVSAVSTTPTSASCAITTGSESSFAGPRMLEHQYGQSLVAVDDDNNSSKTHDSLSTNMSFNPQFKSISNIVQSDYQKHSSNYSASNNRTAKRNNHYNILTTGASDRYRLIGAPHQTFIETVGNALTSKTNASTNTDGQQQMSKMPSHPITSSGDQTDLVAPMSASTSNGTASSHSCSPTKPLLINHTQSNDKVCYSTAGLPTLSGPQLIFPSIITTQAKSESGSAKQQLQQQQFSRPISSSPSSSSLSKTKTSVNSPSKSSSVVASKINTSGDNSSSRISSSNKFSNHQQHNHASSTTSSLVSPMSDLPDQAVTTATSAAPNVITASSRKQTASSSTNGHQSPSAVAGQAVTARLMDMGKRLLDAAREGSTDRVRQLVVSSGAPFTSDWLGTTALHLAAQNGHTEIAEILLKGGVNRDARTKLERTALHLAAQGGNLEVVELLVNNGSDVNARDMLRMTPLHWAVERRHARVVETLLLNDADLNAKSKFQLTPVEIAQNSEFYEILDLFKRWSTANSNGIKNGSPKTFGCNLDARFTESHDMLDVDYHLELTDDNATTSRASVLDIDEPCIDLVELEWNSLKFEPDFFLSNDEEDVSKVEYLMKIVEELQQENRQLRQRVEQLSTTSQ